ncbi:MAG: metallophosphoesterase [Nitrospirota bacterium]|jgi:hypothetical protein
MITAARTTATLLLAIAVCACAYAQTVPDGWGDGEHQAGFHFALIGDVPYTDGQVAGLDRLIDMVNRDAGIEFVVHLGDIKGGSARCDDATFTNRFQQYQRFNAPFIYTPGDNEWTDCHRAKAGRFHPLERLGALRRTFFPEPGRTTGSKRMQVRTQATTPGFDTYVENVLWERAGVVFGTLHVVGSNNDLKPWSGIDPDDSVNHPRRDRIGEYEDRQRAALAWLDEIFATARERRSPGVFLAIHANPRFELARDDPERAGFNDLLTALEAKVIAFGRPVVLAHGDFHFLLIDQPLLGPTVEGPRRRLASFTRIQTFGTDDVHWVRVTVRPASAKVFRFDPVLVEANRARR